MKFYIALLSLTTLTVAASATTIPAAGLAEDIAILEKAYKQLHPGLNRYNTPAQIDAHFADLRRKLNRDSTLEQAFLAFSEFAATIKCGHTYTNFYNQPDGIVDALFKNPNRLPFLFRWLDRRMVISRNLSTDARLVPGTEVLAINGVPAPQILTKLLNIARADGNNTAKRVSYLEVTGVERYDAFDIYFPLYYPQASNKFTLRFRAPNGKAQTATVDAITYAQRIAAGPPEPAKDAPLWTFKYLDANTALLRMPTWVAYNTKWKWEQFLAETFDELRAKKTPNLIIDLRGNEGGSEIAPVIISNLIDKDLTIEARRRRVRYRKTPDDLNKYLDTWDKSFRDWGADAVPSATEGFFDLKDDDGNVARVIKAAPARYTGRVFVFIGAENSSATFQFAQLVKENKLGTLVGQPTGGNQRGINGGGFFFLHLPNSKIELDVPLIGQFPLSEKPDAGIDPDIYVRHTIADIASGADAELNAIRKLLR